MTENGSHQLLVKARFNFKQTNEDELSVCKGDIIYVTRVEEGGWWEGTLNGRTGWFPSNYVREIKSSGKSVFSELSCLGLLSFLGILPANLVALMGQQKLLVLVCVCQK